MDTDTPRAPGRDELDLASVHALQIQPRVPWVRVGKVLEVDAVT
ncbi:transcriptional regulator, partial [Streptomyces griseus]|nr:transcriptional regulator [Streptomyces griseus]